MALDLSECTFIGPALPGPFVRFELEKELNKLRLLPKTTGEEGKKLKAHWEFYRRKLRELTAIGGPIRVRNHVIEPLLASLGYDRIEPADDVQTREERESGGDLLVTTDGTAKLRVWTTSFDEDLDAPAKRGAAYRFSHLRIAQRVLLTCGERFGLLTNGVELRLLISDPARPDSQVVIPVDPGWKRSRDVPDSYFLLLALANPAGVKALPELVDKARLQQARVTKELRVQARQAVEGFVQEILDYPANRDWFQAQADTQALARQLWREGLVTIYRLLFILKLESNDDPARSFSFASNSLWRNTFSPSTALARYVHTILERGIETGGLLESGIRSLFRMFEQGLECTELHVKPLGGALFGSGATPVLSDRHWGERAVAWLLDRLLWTPKRKGAETRERVHYGPLDVEDLGRVYEALLELEPGISTQTMCRLRRQKLEVVVPVAQGEKYRPVTPPTVEVEDSETDEDGDEEVEDSDEEKPARGKKTKVEWIEEIPPGRFYLRVGLGRKASGSYYTPHSFVRFLVQETLGPHVAERSPQDNPQPLEILKLKVLDPAMGSGHFLVEACRFLGAHLYEACRLCDEKALAAERRAEKAGTAEREAALEEARTWRQRVIDLPDPDDLLPAYLPSRSTEGESTGFSQRRAEALCRRLVAVHCLYGVDKNPLAVELAKLSLWLESHAEGMPLTFLDHRFVVGDSLTGPFWDRLIFRPGDPTEPVQNLFQQGLNLKFQNALHDAIRYVRRLEASVGITVAEMREKGAVKAELDHALLPFRVAAAAWSGGVMLGPERCDDVAYAKQLATIADTGHLPERIESDLLLKMIARGLGLEELPTERDELYRTANSGRCVPALPYDLTFPEVFYPTGVPHGRQGFHAVLGNPPWDAIQFKSKEFFASFDFEILNAPTKRERTAIEQQLIADPQIGSLFEFYKEDFEQQKRINDDLYEYQKVQVEGDLAGRQVDAFRVFMERNAQLLVQGGRTGVVVPSAFHANEGATGIRQLYLHQLALQCCYSFENRRKLFEIHRSFKFACVVAGKTGQPTEKFSSAFYIHDDEWLFAAKEPLSYSLDFVRRTGSDYLSLLELRSETDLGIAEVCFVNSEPFGKVCNRLGIRFGAECHMTNDAWRFTATAEVMPNGEDPRDPDVTAQLLEMGFLVLHEGKTFRQYDDRWSNAPRYLVRAGTLLDKPEWMKCSRYFRLVHREIAGPGDENVSIWSMLPPACVCGHKAPTERCPPQRSTLVALWLLGVANARVYDWLLAQRVRASVSAFMRDGLPTPGFSENHKVIIHSAVRLTCNHAGYALLWREQLSDAWREADKEPFSWPVLATDDERWAVRATIDAVVAGAYGLSRDQYEHVLSTFSHASYPTAPKLCLAAFDELKQIGLEAFTRKHDPYWDIPLNENLPQPVIDLPIPSDGASSEEDKGQFQLTGVPEKKRRRRKTK